MRADKHLAIAFYVEPLSDARTKLKAYFNILLESGWNLAPDFYRVNEWPAQVT
jgi:hypothetical protein